MGDLKGADALMNLIPSLKLNDKNIIFQSQYAILSQSEWQGKIIKRKYSRFNCMETSQYVACEIFPL